MQSKYATEHTHTHTHTHANTHTCTHLPSFGFAAVLRPCDPPIGGESKARFHLPGQVCLSFALRCACLVVTSWEACKPSAGEHTRDDLSGAIRRYPLLMLTLFLECNAIAPLAGPYVLYMYVPLHPVTTMRRGWTLTGHAHTHTCTHTHAHTHMHTHTHTHTHMHTHAHTQHTHMHTHTHIPAYTHAHTHIHTRTHTHAQHTHTYTHKHTHIKHLRDACVISVFQPIFKLIAHYSFSP